MLRSPEAKLVSKVSPAGIAPSKSPGWSRGKVKQDALSAGVVPAPEVPVTALREVQLGASGTMGLMIPSYTP